ncbi:bacteriocin immunity protein [Streptococcus ictaluri]|uniref:Enterocin A immunity n=1 Tax=Streptococcus ictaluri 707-05 TaxID=764299 RepID=G5K4C3_9STRE|nr:bacteriocin immunity protein [Streptococcus ictaluri]EHI68847.1 enterocin A immunity [Streptococcus ictaluri 707-05]
MEKAMKRLYDLIKQAYDFPENRENPQLSILFLSASNKLMKDNNPLLVAEELNRKINHYLAINDLLLPKSLCQFKKGLEDYMAKH